MVETHRRQSEWNLQRWLVHMAGKHPDLVLPGLDALPPLPPSSVELQRFFLAAKTKAAFLAKVGEVWKGDFSTLELPCYVKEGASTVWTEVDLGEIEKEWSEGVYETRRKVTQDLLGR